MIAQLRLLPVACLRLGVGVWWGKREGARRGEGAKEAPASNLRAIEKEPARTSPKLVGTPGRAGSRSGAQRSAAAAAAGRCELRLDCEHLSLFGL